MKWITRERPKIDRIACPWLIKKFVDDSAEFIYVPSDEVFRQSEILGAIPYDIAGAEYTHEGERCTFDFKDTDRFDLATQASGLWAISAGLSYNFKNDHEMLTQGMVIYDALYSWAKYVQSEKHTWKSNKL
jgi:hypothetical protein